MKELMKFISFCKVMSLYSCVYIFFCYCMQYRSYILITFAVNRQQPFWSSHRGICLPACSPLLLTGRNQYFRIFSSEKIRSGLCELINCAITWFWWQGRAELQSSGCRVLSGRNPALFLCPFSCIWECSAAVSQHQWPLPCLFFLASLFCWILLSLCFFKAK